MDSNNEIQRNKQQNEINDQKEEDEYNLTLDYIIDNFFQYEDQRRRFKNELSILLANASQKKIKVDLEHSQTNLSIIVGIQTDQFTFCKELTHQLTINFEIYINQRYYPQKGTRIYCRTNFLNPSLSDARDFLNDVLGHKWNNQITLIYIVDKLIQFIEKVSQNKRNTLFMQRIGRFYIGHDYQLEDLKHFEALFRHPCVQFEDNFFLKLNVRIIGITDAHFLLFDAEEKDQWKVKLIFFSDLQNLVEIKRKKEEPNKLLFKWKNYQKVNGYYQYYEQTFQMAEPDLIIKQILKKIQQFQLIKIWSNSYMNFGSQWDVKKQQIEKLTQNVYQYEEEIKHKFNIENVQKLIDSYNQVIEHYSALNDYLADIYLNSLHNLLNRVDVQCLLNYGQELKKNKFIDYQQKEEWTSKEQTEKDAINAQQTFAKSQDALNC